VNALKFGRRTAEHIARISIVSMITFTNPDPLTYQASLLARLWQLMLLCDCARTDAILAGKQSLEAVYHAMMQPDAEHNKSKFK